MVQPRLQYFRTCIQPTLADALATDKTRRRKERRSSGFNTIIRDIWNYKAFFFYFPFNECNWNSQDDLLGRYFLLLREVVVRRPNIRVTILLRHSTLALTVTRVLVSQNVHLLKPFPQQQGTKKRYRNPTRR